MSEGCSKNYASGVYFVKEEKPHYIEVSFSAGNTTLYEYNENCLVATETGSKGSFTYDYELNDNGTVKKTRITDAAGNYVESEYDAKGNVDTVSDYSNTILNLVDNDYDASGKLLQTKDGDGGSIILGYDSSNRVKSVTDQMNKEILKLHYDSVTGNVDTQTDARGVETSFKDYDANGRWGEAEFTRTVSEGVTELVTTKNIYDNLGHA